MSKNLKKKANDDADDDGEFFEEEELKQLVDLVKVELSQLKN